MSGPTDEEMEARVIGGPTVHDSTIDLADYDPAWPAVFHQEAARIRAALGAVALAVDHVGSTSVPGLAAKPVIDIVLTVSDSSDEAAYVPALEGAGNVLRIRAPEFEHRLLKGPDVDVNAHAFSDGSAEIDRMLSFRDHLRREAADRQLYEATKRQLYEATKRQLASRRWKYVQQYADAKSDVIADIMTRSKPAQR